MAAFLRERAAALGGGEGAGEGAVAGSGPEGGRKGEGDAAFHQPPVDGAAEYDDADDDVLGAAEAAMARAMQQQQGEGEGDGRAEGEAARRARAAAAEAEQEAKKKALLARHAVLAGGGEQGEVKLSLTRVPRWRRGVGGGGGGGGGGDEGE